MSSNSMSAADKLAAMKVQLAELERLAEEEQRQEEEWRKAEEEKRRAKEEEKRKAEEERQRTEEERRRTAELASQAIPQKRKSTHPDSEYEEDEEDEEQGEEAEVLHKPSSPCDSCRSLGRKCRFRDGPWTSSCTNCQRRAAPCLNVKGLLAPMQAQVDKKSKSSESPQRKRMKKSAPIVDDDDEPATPTKKLKGKGKAKEVGPEQRSTEKGKETRVAESGGEGSGRISLGREEREWSMDPEPEQLTDRELLRHLLVEGQKTRLRMSRLLHHLEEEGNLRAEWAITDSKVMCQAVRKEMGKWAEEELRPLIREEIRSVLAEFFETPAEQEGRGEGEGEGQKGEGEEGGEEGAPAE
ncbi:hypothetical protein ACG7TL_004640 [Trametes sanguinea]